MSRLQRFCLVLPSLCVILAAAPSVSPAQEAEACGQECLTAYRKCVFYGVDPYCLQILGQCMEACN